MLKNVKIGIIGTGNMGEALIGGLIQSGSSNPKNLFCFDTRNSKLEYMEETYGITSVKNNLELIKNSEIIIYAVKPQMMAAALKETSSLLDETKLIISVAAGVPLIAIEQSLEKKLRLVRVMPNVGVAVKEGATAIAAGKHATKNDIKLTESIFNSVGKTVFLSENSLMDAITGLSGSGPAYIFLMIDAMADAGVKMGLSREDSLFLSAQTVLGAAKLLLETNEHPGKLKDMVTSPGGTAIAGLHTLEEGGLRTTIINAVEAATNRSKDLGAIMIKNFSENGV